MAEHLTVSVQPTYMLPSDRWVVDPATGQILGVQSARGGSRTCWFGPIRMTAAQIADPTADMIADTSAIYMLNVAPFTRYVSNGTILKAVQTA